MIGLALIYNWLVMEWSVDVYLMLKQQWGNFILWWTETPQGSEEDGGGRANVMGEKTKHVNISMRDGNLMLRDLRHSFSSLW